MKRRSVLMISILVMLFCFSIQAYAQEPALEFYNRSIAEDLDGDPDAVRDVEREIMEQAQAMMEMNGMDGAAALRFSGAMEPVKVVSSGSASPSELLEQLGGANGVAAQKARGNTEDIFENDVLEYSWKVPVAETEEGYLYATVHINSPEDIAVSSTLAANQEVNDATYLFDRELIPDILANSGLNVDYDGVLPVSLPVISTDIVLFSADQVQYGIPFSARPDFLEVENGKIYEFEELEAAVNKLLTELSAGNAGPAQPVGGGAGQPVNAQNAAEEHVGFAPHVLICSLAGVMVCAGGVVILYIKRKGT